MKALNRAISRTVSQLARFGGDEYHPLMKHALVQHLSFLLAMERKQLEQAGMKVANIGAGAVDVFASNLSALQQQLAEKATPLQPHANDSAPPAPDVIDMTDPRNWQAGDILLLDAPTFGAEFQQRCEYVVSSVHDGHNIVYIYKDDGRTHGYRLDLLRRNQPFKWLRHGEAQQ